MKKKVINKKPKEKKELSDKYNILIQYFKINKVQVILSCIIAIFISFISIYIPILVSKAVDNVVDIYDVNFDMVMEFMGIIGVFTVISAFLELIMNKINNKFASNMTKRFRNMLSKKINVLELSFIDSNSKGDIISRVINDTEVTVEGLYLVLSKGIVSLFTALFTVLFMIKIHYKLALIVIILAPASIVASKIIVNLVKKYFKKEAEIIGEQSSYLNEVIYNQKNIIAFTNEEKMIEKFEVINENLENISIKAKFFSSLTNPISRFINNIIYAIVAILGAFNVMNGIFSVGILTAFLNYASKYNKPFNDISEVISELETSFARLDRINEILHKKDEKNEGTAILNLNNEYTQSPIIKFKDVSFGYAKNKPVIKNVSFEINNNQKIAIVGKTGCGKTTLINLLMRFYEIDSGSILVYDTNIAEYTKESYRENFGMVLQTPYLKKDTIMNNLKMGNKNIKDEDVYEATKITKCFDIISKLPDGFNTIVSDTNNILSEGEKQLIAISRVMIANPKILILDEATSNIDTRTELIVQEAFNNLMNGKTSIVIAHRLSTIKLADKILVMDDGKIIEEGNHSQLMNKKGHYFQLQSKQLAN